MARGTLVVVATPIGNLGDLSARAIEELGRADLVAAEDTRHSGRLLAHLGLHKPLLSCHKFNEAERTDGLLAALDAGKRVALVTDGGTPAVSDPGHRIVAAAHAAGHAVVAIPGPSAVVAALSVAGFPADRFVVAGFLPSQTAARRARLAELAALPDTLVLFEAPHRLAEALDDAVVVLGARPATLCRELTKLHEEVRRSTLPELAEMIRNRAEVLGEIVLVVAGADPATRHRAASASAPGEVPRSADEETLAQRFAAAREAEDGDIRRALRRLAREDGVARDALRRRLQQLGLVD